MPGDGAEAGSAWRIIELVQQLGVESRRLGHAFASDQGLHETDLDALLHVLHAERHGNPTTAGRLATALGVTSGAATAVIDRLERHGHLQRRRDDRDRRKVVLHYGPEGMRVAEDFFGPLSRVTEEVVSGFTDDELASIARFLARMSEAMGESGSR